MFKVAIVIIAFGLGYIGLGYYNNNPAQRSFGLKIAVVGLLLIVAGSFFDLALFPSVGLQTQ